MPKSQLKEIFSTPEAKIKIHRLAQEYRDSLNIPMKDRYVKTSFGKTHVIEAGNTAGPKVVVLHGTSTCAAYSFTFTKGLLKDYHLHLVDTPGQPGLSDQTIINPKNNSFGEWLHETLEQLDFQAAHFLGFSHGSFILLRLAAIHPEWIDKAVFVCPGGIVDMSIFKIMKHIAIPQHKFRKTGLEKHFDTFAKPFITDMDNYNSREYLKETTLNVKPDTRRFKNASKSEMKNFMGDKLILACENDILFPMNKLQKKVYKIFPGNIEFEVLKGQKHLPSLREDYTKKISDRIDVFLKGRENMQH